MTHRWSSLLGTKLLSSRHTLEAGVSEPSLSEPARSPRGWGAPCAAAEATQAPRGPPVSLGPLLPWLSGCVRYLVPAGSWPPLHPRSPRPGAVSSSILTQ